MQQRRTRPLRDIHQYRDIEIWERRRCSLDAEGAVCHRNVQRVLLAGAVNSHAP